jgi:hypothetical protein
MSDTELLKEALEYLAGSRFARLTYIRPDGSPVTRTVGSFAPDGPNIVFSTQTKTAKAAAIADHERISFFFEHDNQEPAKWINVLAIGDAVLPRNDSELSRSVDILSRRNPRFKERVDKEGLTGTSIFILRTKEIQYLNRAKGVGGATVISVNK